MSATVLWLAGGFFRRVIRSVTGRLWLVYRWGIGLVTGIGAFLGRFAGVWCRFILSGLHDGYS